MNYRLKWSTWPLWVFYGWYWYPDAQRYLFGEHDDPMMVRYWVEHARQMANGGWDEIE